MLRVAELCAGYGGLYRSMVLAGWPVELAWYAENDSDASRVLAAHHPGVPNVDDLTEAQFSAQEPVDMVAAGFPCTDVSAAGRRAGLMPGTRSGLWTQIARAIRILRPPLVFLENVRGLLSARAHSDVEPCPWCVGDPPDEHALRALGAVLADLASLGFDAEWVSVRAGDIGAPHRRERVFVLAWPAAHPDRHAVWPEPVRVGARQHTAVAGNDREGTDLALLPTPNAALGRATGFPSPELAKDRYDRGTRCLDDAVALLPSPRATDGTKGGPNQRGSSGDLTLPSAVQLLPTPATTDARGARNATATRRSPKATTNTEGWTLGDVAHADRWGTYGAAIRRWEQVSGRPAPDPTEPGTRGQPRLSARFVEWMQGLPAGYVTDHVGRNAALRILGNGVVPQQGSWALRLLADAEMEVGSHA